MPNDNLSVQNFVQITVESVPSGADQPNVNSLAFFTTEQPDNGEDYNVFLDASSVAEQYGTESQAYKMALALFSQSSNVISGGGRLVAIPYVDAVLATSGNFTTANISENLAALIAVTDGDLKVTLDQVAHDLSGLDFSGATTLADIAAILQKELPNAICSATATTITIKSKKVGAEADVVLAAYSGGGTDLTGAGLLNTSAGTATSGANASGETMIQAIARTKAQIQYCGIITDLEMEDSVIQATSNAVQAEDMIWVHSVSSTADLAGIATDIKDATNTKTRIVLYTPSAASAQLMRAAYAGLGFSVDFSAEKSVKTMNAKRLATILPDTGLDQTILTNAKAAGVDVYGNFGGNSLLYTSGQNAYFDEVYTNQWIKFALQTAQLNLLIQTGTKIPQTSDGTDLVLNSAKLVMKQAVFNGMLGVGLTWNSPNVFGNPADLRRNITDFGFYIYIVPISQQSQADREERKCPPMRMAAKRSGAIHSISGWVIIEA